MSGLVIKAGATLQLLLTISDDDGTAVDVTSMTIASQVRDPYGKLVANLDITNTGTTGLLSIVQSTSAWPTGTLQMDVRLTDGTGTVLISDTQAILVSPAVTQ